MVSPFSELNPEDIPPLETPPTFEGVILNLVRRKAALRFELAQICRAISDLKTMQAARIESEASRNKAKLDAATELRESAGKHKEHVIELEGELGETVRIRFNPYEALMGMIKDSLADDLEDEE